MKAMAHHGVAWNRLRQSAVLTALLALPLAVGPVWATPGASPSSKASDLRGYDRLGQELERLRTRWKVPGMVAGVAQADQVVWERGFGFADLASRRPATPDTVFHLASLTKPFAAVVLLQLVEAGRLDLDAPVSDFGVALTAEGTIHWHYGWDRANSTLLIKVPQRQVTFVLLGNSEALSRKFDLGRDANVMRPPFAKAFLRSVGL